MVKPPQGVLFGPIVNCRAGHSNISLKYDRNEEIKKVQWYVLEDIPNCSKIPKFYELVGQVKLETVARRTFKTFPPLVEQANGPN